MNQQIDGEIFSPCYMSEDDFENGYKKSVFYVEKDYMQAYRRHLIAMDHVANIAKSYILKNWKAITDWSDLEVEIVHGPTNHVTRYYTYKPEDRVNPHQNKTQAWQTIWDEIDARNKQRHNPIISVNSVVLDPTDGDFSITINGNEEHWWIQNEAVIIIADYIERKINQVINEDTQSSSK